MLAYVLLLMYIPVLSLGMFNDSTCAKFAFPSITKYMSNTYLRLQGDISTHTTTKNGTIYACHPHGILPCSTFYFLTNYVPVVVDKVMLSTLLGPFMFKYLGYIDNTRECIVRNLSQHGSIALYPGGADELCLTKGDSKDIIIYIREDSYALPLKRNTP